MVAHRKQDQDCKLKVLQHVVMVSKYIAEQVIAYVVHLFSYSRHIGVAVSSLCSDEGRIPAC